MKIRGASDMQAPENRCAPTGGTNTWTSVVTEACPRSKRGVSNQERAIALGDVTASDRETIFQAVVSANRARRAALFKAWPGW